MPLDTIYWWTGAILWSAIVAALFWFFFSLTSAALVASMKLLIDCRQHQRAKGAWPKKGKWDYFLVRWEKAFTVVFVFAYAPFEVIAQVRLHGFWYAA